jgi:hypothetical protein
MPQAFSAATSNVDVADLNGDGKADLSTGQALTGKMSVFENKGAANGSLNLGAAVDFTAGNYDTFVKAADLDGDGKPEIAVANTILNTVTIFGNKIGDPVITQLSIPAAKMGDTVVIHGTNFTGARAVTFGGTPAGSFTVVSATRIDALPGGGASGEISVTTPSGTGTIGGFSFLPGVTAKGALSFCNGGSVTLSSTALANNQWYKNGTAIAGATAATYQATGSGTYTVKTTGNGITTTSPEGVTVNVTTVPRPTISLSGSVLSSSATAGNQWYLNGTAVAGATAQTYQPVQSGTYTVQASANGCNSNVSAPYNYVMTGLLNLGNNQSVALWPNPVKDHFFLHWTIGNLNALSVAVVDVQGKTVLRQSKVQAGKPVYLSTLPAGYYFVKLFANEQKLLGTLKIFKGN